MNSNWVFIAYYIWALTLLILTGYVVFFLGFSGWWFLFTTIIISATPEVTNKE